VSGKRAERGYEFTIVKDATAGNYSDKEMRMLLETFR